MSGLIDGAVTKKLYRDEFSKDLDRRLVSMFQAHENELPRNSSLAVGGVDAKGHWIALPSILADVAIDIIGEKLVTAYANVQRRIEQWFWEWRKHPEKKIPEVKVAITHSRTFTVEMKTKKKVPNNFGVNRERRFAILHRDNFTCRYCGVRPGSERLQADHLVPKSKDGGDRDENLVAACSTCNQRKSGSIFFPPDMIESQDDEGWFVHKTFGLWSIRFCPSQIVMTREEDDYWFDARRIYDPGFISHLQSKTWFESQSRDIFDCVNYLEKLIRPPHG